MIQKPLAFQLPIAMILLLCLALTLVLGCSREEYFQRELPPGSTDIKMISGTHCTFKWRGQPYLFGWSGHAKYMVPISEKDKE